jgi:NCS1 family nucleobase:cation symporter-1
VPSLLRSVIACGWFGIQTWIGGFAISVILGILWPGWSTIGGSWTFMGHGAPVFLGFVIFWLINMYFVWAGTESIKWMETLSAPFLLATGLALLVWAAGKGGGLGTVLAASDRLAQAGSTPASTSGFVLGLFIPWLTAMVGFWATLSLNIPDFTRYARSQRDQTIGQAIGLLTTMPLFAFIGIAVTSATVLMYGEAIWNPIDLLARLTREQGSPLLGILSMVVLLVATLTTNIAANIVAPANSFSNLSPRRISFRAGGLLAGVIGVVILPWKLLDMYQTWLITYSGLLGAAGGVLMCDYLVIRRTRLDVDALYDARGSYGYRSGFNIQALIALACGVAVALVGRVVPGLGFLFSGAWFSATAVAFLVYWALMKGSIASAALVGGESRSGLPASLV